MDGRRRPHSFGRAAPGAFASRSGSGAPGARPTSAGKDRGLTRQISAPSLASSANPSISIDAFAARVANGSSYDAFSRSGSSPALRRSSSATAMGPRSVPGLRSGFASAPRRRLYESPSAYATPEREWELAGHRGPGLGSGEVGGGFQTRADALQLESRLTEQLREHSLSGSDGATRRPLGGFRGRGGASGWPSQQSWHEDGYGPPAGYEQPLQARFATPGQQFRSEMADDAGPRSRFFGSQGWGGNDRRSQPMQPPPSASMMSMSSPMEGHQYGSRGGARGPKAGHDSFSAGGVTPPQLRSDLSRTAHSDSGGLPESRLKIYSDLFEEVIERDRVFGSLLRKIKTAYDMLLLRSPPVPPLPMDPSSHHTYESMDQNSWGGQDPRGPGSLHSNEPTTRADGGQAWEMQKENRVLKDLVERLHLELEEAVRREHRWKQKVTKLKARVDTSDAKQTPPQGYSSNSYGKVIDENWPLGISGHPSKPSQASEYHVGYQRDDHDVLKNASQGGAPSFHASRREPSLSEVEPQEGPLNQGGLLSMSSISPQTSVPPLPESFGVDCAESARSTDSGMLPQRPTRRQVVRPLNVPRLDFSRLKFEEDEEDDDMEGEGQDDEGFEEQDLDDEIQPHQLRSMHDRGEDEDDQEDACWPSFDNCSIRQAGHLCHQPAKVGSKFARPPNPMGYDDCEGDDNEYLPEGMSGPMSEDDED